MMGRAGKVSLGLIGWVVVGVMGVSGWAGQPAPNYPVRVEFLDAPGDGIRSDGLGVYEHGLDGVYAVLNGSTGRFDFFSCSGSRRTNSCPGPRSIFFDFSQLATDVLGDAARPGPTSLGLPFLWGNANATLTVDLVDVNNEIWPLGLVGMSEGEQMVGFLKSNFADPSGLLYTVRFRTAPDADSSPVLVTFLGGELACGDSVPCAQWSIEALNGSVQNPDPLCCVTHQLEDIGTLLSDNTNDEGDYHMPFMMTLTVLPQSGDSTGGGKGKNR